MIRRSHRAVKHVLAFVALVGITAGYAAVGQNNNRDHCRHRHLIQPGA